MNLVDVYSLRGSCAAHSVADSQRRSSNQGISIQKVFTPFYHTLRDTFTLSGFLRFLRFRLSVRLTKMPTKKVNYIHWWDYTPHATVEGNFHLLADLDDQAINPLSVNGRLNGEMQLWLLQDDLPSILEYILLNKQGRMYCQHHGAPPRFSRADRYFLYDHFRGRWIGRGDLQLDTQISGSKRNGLFCVRMDERTCL
jgi:hypothetical protein